MYFPDEVPYSHILPTDKRFTRHTKGVEMNALYYFRHKTNRIPPQDYIQTDKDTIRFFIHHRCFAIQR